jgi:hypothetical protein
LTASMLRRQRIFQCRIIANIVKTRSPYTAEQLCSTGCSMVLTAKM